MIAVRRLIVSAGLVATILLIGFTALPGVASAASPTPSGIGGDTRSPGEGPGLVGAPFLAIGGVIALGLVTAGLTVVYLRLSASKPPDRGATGRS